MKPLLKIFGLWLTGTLLFTPGLSAKDKAKTGHLSKDTFTDSAFGYRTSIPGVWKAKVKDEPSLVRLAMEKGDLQINPRYSIERSNAGTRPRFLIMADTTSHPLDDFADLLFGDRNWKKKGEYLKALDWRPQDKEVERKRVTVAGLPGVQLTLLRDMTGYFGETEVPSPGSELRAEVVTLFKRGNKIFVTILFSSHFFLENNFKDALPVFMEWKFLELPEASETDSSKSGQ